MSFLKKHAAILSIAFAGLIARLLALTRYGDFWGDEMFSFVYSQKPWLTSLRYWAMETNPPLHMVVLKLWWYVFPTTEWWARLPSVIFGMMSIWALYTFAQKLFNKRTATLAAILLALSPYHIFISATARGYALFLFLVILSLYFFHALFIAGETTKKNYWLFGLVTLGLLYTHLTSLLLLATEGISLILLDRDSSATRLGRAQNDNRWRAIKKFLLVTLPAAGLWLPWAIPAFYFKLHNPSFGQAWFFNIQPTFQTWLEALHPLFGAQNPPLQFFIIMSVFPVLISYTIYQQKKSGGINKIFLYLLTTFFVLPAVATCLGLLNIKFFAIAVPPAIILTAYLVNFCFSSQILASLLLAGLLIPNLLNFSHLFPIEDWRTVNGFVDARLQPSKKQLFISTNFTDQPRVNRYFKPNIASLPYYPYDEKLWDEMAITKNYILPNRSDLEMATWYQEKNIARYDEIFLLQHTNLGQIYLHEFLEKNNWKLTASMSPRLVCDDCKLLYYVHP